MGRYLPYRLHPLSVAETAMPPPPDEMLARTVTNHSFSDLLKLGGFPEPFFDRPQTWGPVSKTSPPFIS